MDSILSQVTLSSEHPTFSFDSYKLTSDTEESELGDSNDNISINFYRHEESFNGDRTPSSHSAVVSNSAESTMIESEEPLNTPVSTSSGVSSFFSCEITSMPEPVPISGELEFLSFPQSWQAWYMTSWRRFLCFFSSLWECILGFHKKIFRERQYLNMALAA